MQSPGKMVYRIIIFRYYHQKIEKYSSVKIKMLYESQAKIQYKIILLGNSFLLKLQVCHVSTI